MATRTVAPAKKAPRAPAKRAKRAPAAATNQAQVVPGTTPGTSKPAETDTALVPGTTRDLNPRQRAFVAEYLKDKNATQAYVRAYGVSASVAESAGPRLFGHVRVAAEIERLERQMLAEVQRDTGITLERTLKEIARIAFFDPRKLFNANGQPLEVTELDDDTAAAIAGLDVLEEWEGAGKDRVLVGYVKKYKIATKLDALEKLMRNLGGYKADHDQGNNPLAKLLEGMGRSTLPIAQTVPDDDE